MHGIYKAIKQPFPIIGIGLIIMLPHLLKHEFDLPLIQFRRAQFAAFNFKLQFCLRSLKLLQSLLCGFGYDAAFNGRHEVGQRLLGIGKLALHKNQLCIRGGVGALHLHAPAGNAVDAGLILQDIFNSAIGYQRIKHIPSDVAFGTSLFPHPLGASVIIMAGTVAAIGGNAYHAAAAFTTIQLAGKRIFFMGLVPARRAVVCCKACLHPVK